MEKRKARPEKGRKAGILSVLLVIFVFGFVFSAYKALSILFEDRHADTAYSELRELSREQAAAESTGEADSTGNEAAEPAETVHVPKRAHSMDIPSLQKSFPELSGWILADGVGIDYPIMRGTDNDYYLTHLYDGTANANGAIFIDCRNTGIFTDDNTVIYGHNMGNGGMFHGLNEYKYRNFYIEHPTISIFTAEGDYRVELICGTVEDGNYEFVQFRFDSFGEMSEYVEGFRARSTFSSDVVLQEGDKLVSLCTCSYEEDNARYMLIGRIAEVYE